MLSRRGPILPLRAAKTLTNRKVVGVLFCDVRGNRQLRPEHKWDLERIAEIWVL